MNDFFLSVVFAAALTFGVVLAGIEAFLRYDRKRARRAHTLARVYSDRGGVADVAEVTPHGLRATARLAGRPSSARAAGVNELEIEDYAAFAEHSLYREQQVRR